MWFRRAVNILLICAILLHGQLQPTLAYTQVSTSASGHSEEGPKIYKALNFDLVFPKSFNSSGSLISATPSGTIVTGSPATDVVGFGDRRQYNPLPQSNEQTNRDDDVSDNQPLYITPTPNEAALYQTYNTNNNDKDNAQVVTQNPINIQQPRLQQNDKTNNNHDAKEQPNVATGRAVDYRTGYPFGQLITPLIKNAPHSVVYSSRGKPMTITSSATPLSSLPSSSSNVAKPVVYPQSVYQRKPPSEAEIDKLRGKGNIRDRFTPSEAVASHQIKASNHNHHDHHHNHAPTYTVSGKVPASSNVVNTYVPPKNLYSFPPNNINYPSPSQDNKLALPTSVVNSYSPPASGPLKNANYPLAAESSNDNGYKYTGPLNLGYLPSINNNDNGADTKDQKDNDDGNGDGDSDVSDADTGNMDDSIGVLPASAMDGDNNAGDMDAMDDMLMKDAHSYDTEKEYPTPPPEWLKAHPEAANDHPPHDGDDEHHHDEHHHDEHHHDEHHSDIAFDHDHHHDHHHPEIILDHDSYHHHSFPSFPIYPHYPEIIYDDHHDHHHHHVEPPPTTTEAPPPEPPPEPRVKKYSYFYIGRKLWYIPLYFTVWFSFYVLWLILKSIARHKVNLPNHYVSRRSIDNYNLSKSQQETIDQLTVSVMDKIDKFKTKHLS